MKNKKKTVTNLIIDDYIEITEPIVGNEYHAFDDGKINWSRHKVVDIVKKVKLRHLSLKAQKLIKDDIKNCYWLFAKKQSYVYVGYLRPFEDITIEEPQYFIKTLCRGWFSIGWWGARLDVDGHLYKSLCDNDSEGIE